MNVFRVVSVIFWAVVAVIVIIAVIAAIIFRKGDFKGGIKR